MAYPCHAHSDSASENFKISRACTTLPLAKIGGVSESKINLDLFCASLNLHYFAFGEDRRRLENESKKLRILLCISLNLHYFACGEDRLHLGIKNKFIFILCFSRFALSLLMEPQKRKNNASDSLQEQQCDQKFSRGMLFARCLSRFC